MSDDKDHEKSDMEDEEEEQQEKHHKDKGRKKRKSPEKASKTKKSKKQKTDKADEEETKEPSKWSELDKKQSEMKVEEKTQAPTSTVLVSTASVEEKKIVAVPKNEPYLDPNGWLATHPNHFSKIRIPEDIHFEKWKIPEGMQNGGKMTCRISHKKSLGANLLVVGPWMGLYKAYFGMDGNATDPKALQFNKDSSKPHLNANYFLGYLSKTWDANLDNGFGNDKHAAAFALWHAKLSLLFFKYIATNDDLLPGLKNLDEKPSPEIIYKRLIKHFRGTVLQLPEKDTTTDSKNRPPLAAVDPASITSCDQGIWIIKQKAPVYFNFKASVTRPEKPPAGPMVHQNDKLREAYDLNYIFNHVPLYAGRSHDAVAYNKAKLSPKDVVSSMVEIKPFLQGIDSKTNTALFGIGQRIKFARIYKQGAAIDIQELANRFEDAELPGEEFIDFESGSSDSSTSASTSSSSSSVSKEDKQKMTEMLALPAPGSGGSGAKGYMKV